ELAQRQKRGKKIEIQRKISQTVLSDLDVESKTFIDKDEFKDIAGLQIPLLDDFGEDGGKQIATTVMPLSYYRPWMLDELYF
ncbi:MAG TPA: hypothetical protein VF172_05705, partial [Nitrososphaera sp.]